LICWRFALCKLTEVFSFVPVPIQPHIYVKREISINEYKAKAAIAEHDAKVANQFLVYGYAEEFSRFQKEAGVYKDGKPSAQEDKKSFQEKSDNDRKLSKQIDEKG
jgi:hypothetical protein